MVECSRGAYPGQRWESRRESFQCPVTSPLCTPLMKNSGKALNGCSWPEADYRKYQLSGKLTVNDVPLISSELTDTRPPCALAISLTINKPRPTLRTPF